MKYFVLVLLFFTQFVFAETVPFDGMFWNETQQLNYEGSDFKVGEHQSAGHLQKHRMFNVLNENPYLHYTTFPVGVIDIGMHENHHDFHRFLQTTNHREDFHGTATTGIFALSQTGNRQGTQGVVNSFVYYSDSSDDMTSIYNTMTNTRVVNHSFTLNLCTSYRAYKDYLDNGKNNLPGYCVWNGGDVYDETDRLVHIQASQALRTYYISKPKIMFVLSAGNRTVDASWENGAVHYRIENGQAVFDPLDNVMVVGAVGYDNYLHYYSNFGESVDVAVISGVLAPRCVDANGSYYYKDSDEYNYGVFDDQFSHINGDNHCKPLVYFDLEFNGTSASAPINAGMVALLQNMSNDFTPAEIKLALKNNTDAFATQRFLPNLIWSQREILPHPIPIPDLQSSYTVLKNRLQIETYQDISALNGVDITASNDVQCINVWNAGTSERTVVGSGKSYEAKFYGDRCLFFRGNSYIIDFDLTTKTATRQEFSGYGANKFREYMTFRSLTNNLKTAQNDEDWRNGYEVALNGSEKVGCTVADNCVNGNITTVEQCTNLFKAITGDFPNVMGYSQTALKSQNVCTYETTKVVVEYDANVGEVKVVKKYVKTEFEKLYDAYKLKIQWLNQIWLDDPYKEYWMNLPYDFIPVYLPELNMEIHYSRLGEFNGSLTINDEIADIMDLVTQSPVPYILLSPRKRLYISNDFTQSFSDDRVTGELKFFNSFSFP